MAVPLSDLEFYKLNYRGEIFPLFGDFTLHLQEVGYGDGYADTSELPFYALAWFWVSEGYENNTLGPRSTHQLFTQPTPRLQELTRTGDPPNLVV